MNEKFGINGLDTWTEKTRKPFVLYDKTFLFENHLFSSSCRSEERNLSMRFDERFLLNSMKCNFQDWYTTVEGTGFCAVLFLLNLTGENHKLSSLTSRQALIFKLKEIIESNKGSMASVDEKKDMLQKLRHMIKVLTDHKSSIVPPTLLEPHWVGTALIVNFSLLHDTSLKLMLWGVKDGACVYEGYNQCPRIRQRLSVESFRGIISHDDVFHVIHHESHFFLPPDKGLFHLQLRNNFTIACKEINKQIDRYKQDQSIKTNAFAV